jgi:imidazole glycerol phosphate synthase subunit HisF
MWMLVLKNWRIFGAAAGVLAILAALWYMRHDARQDGYKACQAAQVAATAKAATVARETLDEVRHETSHMSDTAIDADLAALGILRRPEDR